MNTQKFALTYYIVIKIVVSVVRGQKSGIKKVGEPLILSPFFVKKTIEIHFIKSAEYKHQKETQTVGVGGAIFD